MSLSRGIGNCGSLSFVEVIAEHKLRKRSDNPLGYGNRSLNRRLCSDNGSVDGKCRTFLVIQFRSNRLPLYGNYRLASILQDGGNR
ncbi:hypothetical protein D3C75_925790 [compost metagenome]